LLKPAVLKRHGSIWPILRINSQKFSDKEPGFLRNVFPVFCWLKLFSLFDLLELHSYLIFSFYPRKRTYSTVEQLVGDNTDTPQVTFLIEGLVLKHFRGNILHGATTVIERRILVPFLPCKAKVDEDDAMIVIFVTEQVFQLKISVDHVISMQVANTRKTLTDEIPNLIFGELSISLDEHFRHVTSFHMFHHQMDVLVVMVRAKKFDRIW